MTPLTLKTKRYPIGIGKATCPACGAQATFFRVLQKRAIVALFIPFLPLGQNIKMYCTACGDYHKRVDFDVEFDPITGKELKANPSE